MAACNQCGAGDCCSVCCASCRARGAQTNEERAAEAIARILAPFVGPAPTEADDGVFEIPPSEQHYDVRAIVRAALRKLEVYDAGGCPLCLG